jgi:hypothetical protein
MFSRVLTIRPVCWHAFSGHRAELSQTLLIHHADIPSINVSSFHEPTSFHLSINSWTKRPGWSDAPPHFSSSPFEFAITASPIPSGGGKSWQV